MAAVAKRGTDAIFADLRTQLTIGSQLKIGETQNVRAVELFNELFACVDSDCAVNVREFVSSLGQFSDQCSRIVDKCNRYYLERKEGAAAAPADDPLKALSTAEARVRFIEGKGECCITINPNYPLQITVLSHGKNKGRWIQDGVVLLTRTEFLNAKHPLLGDKKIKTVVILTWDIRIIANLPKGHNYYILVKPSKFVADFSNSIFIPMEDLGKAIEPNRDLAVFGISDIFNPRVLRYLEKREKRIAPTFSIFKDLDAHLENLSKGTILDHQTPFSGWDLVKRLYLEKVAFTSLTDKEFDEAFCKIIGLMKAYSEVFGDGSEEHFIYSNMGCKETASIDFGTNFRAFVQHVRQMLASTPKAPDKLKEHVGGLKKSDPSAYSTYNCDFSLMDYVNMDPNKVDPSIEDLYMANGVVHNLESQIKRKLSSPKLQIGRVMLGNFSIDDF